MEVPKKNLREFQWNSEKILRGIPKGIPKEIKKGISLDILKEILNQNPKGILKGILKGKPEEKSRGNFKENSKRISERKKCQRKFRKDYKPMQICKSEGNCVQCLAKFPKESLKEFMEKFHEGIFDVTFLDEYFETFLKKLPRWIPVRMLWGFCGEKIKSWRHFRSII